MPAQCLTKQSISSALAREVLEAARAKAAEMNIPSTISVCDEAGIIKAFERMDGAQQLTVEIAMNKAKTAVGFGIPTHAWHDFVKDDAPLAMGAPHIRDLVVFGGGYPIKIGDQVVGGIGVSGGHYTHDMQIAEAALAAIA